MLPAPNENFPVNATKSPAAPFAEGGWGDLCAHSEVGAAFSLDDHGWKPLPQKQFSTFLQAKLV
jgi:hypothetical protein